MRRFLAILTVVVLALPARAHFIWLLPDRASGPARMVFSDELAPDKNVPITKIARTKLTATGMDGKVVDIKMGEDKHSYQVSWPVGADIVAVGGACQYGVIAKGKGEPFLLMYYPKTIVGKTQGLRPKETLAPAFAKGWTRLPLEIDYVGGKDGLYRVLWQGKPLPNAEVVLLVTGVEEPVTKTTNGEGGFNLDAPKGAGLYGIRARHIEKKEGALDGKDYKEVKHYATLTLRTRAENTSDSNAADAKPDADPAATKLLADARAARAVWTDFPGFTADVEVNVDGKLQKGTAHVSAKGKVTLKLDDDAKDSVRREITSLVAHRLPGGATDTPCAFTDDQAHHPQGRTIRVLNDELHSSYRIRDRQIMEVNRSMGDARFTISVQENLWNKEKQYFPVFYVVNTWDKKTNTLKSSQSHHNTWTRLDHFDLPVTSSTVTATAGQLSSRVITFSNHKLDTATATKR